MWTWVIRLLLKPGKNQRHFRLHYTSVFEKLLTKINTVCNQQFARIFFYR